MADGSPGADLTDRVREFRARTDFGFLAEHLLQGDGFPTQQATADFCRPQRENLSAF
jgi:hypothetical protein